MMEGEIMKKDGKEGARRATGVPSFFPGKQEGLTLSEGLADPGAWAHCLGEKVFTLPI